MLCGSIKDFVALLPPRGGLLGIDWGKKRIGVAITDYRRKFAFPRETVNCQLSIVNLINSENIVGIVIGLPLYFNGAESDTTKKVRAFAMGLAKQINVPIVLFDETLTSFEAAENLTESPPRRKANPRNNNLDSKSAGIILENAIAVINRL
jgi:putative Holliday junction resolvase